LEYDLRQTNLLPAADSSTGITPQGTTYSISGNKKINRRGCSTLVLIHGVGLNKAVWHPQIKAFSDDFKVIAYDLLGHGDSPLPPSRPTLRDYAAQRAELLDHLSLRQAHIAGHSMGALISIAFALAYAHRACSVIAMNIVYQRNAVQREAVLKRAEAVLQSNQIDGIELALQRWFDKETGTEALQKIARVRQWMKQADPAGYGRSYQFFAALGKMHEWELHCRGALTNGVSKQEIRAIVHAIAIYRGVPQGMECFRAARKVLEEAGEL
jgi:pimeloyl-ACP methyl ester carboxylesterase